MWGMSRSDWEAEQVAFELWPENKTACDVWYLVGDQWNMGSGGPVSINLMTVQHQLDRMGLEKEDYDDLLHDIRFMADAALGEISASRA